MNMEKRLVALVFIALLIGLGGGYGLGYVIYQPQIESLQSDISNIQSDVSDLQSKSSTVTINFESLNATYNELMINYSYLQSALNVLSTDYDSLSMTYKNLFTSYQELMINYDELNATCCDLLADYEDMIAIYDELNVAYYNLLADYEELVTIYDNLSEMYNDLEAKYRELLSNYTLERLASYIIRINGSTIEAVNGSTGKIDYSGADARTVIQSAIDTLPSTGGHVHFKSLFTLTAQIDLIGNLVLSGEGMGTGLKTSDNLNIYLVNGNDVDNIAFVNLELDGNKANRPGSGWTKSGAYFWECDRVSFISCYIHDFPTGSNVPAIYSASEGVDNPGSIHISNSYSWGNEYGFVMGSLLQKLSIIGCESNGDAKFVAALRGFGVKVIGNTILNGISSTKPSIFFEYPSPEDPEEFYGQNIVVNNYFYNNSNCIRVTDKVTNVLIEGNVFRSNTQILDLAAFDYPDQVIIRNNVGLNPYGQITTPFNTGFNTIGLMGNSSAPSANTDYTIVSFDQLITSTGGTGVSITIMDPSDNIVASGLTSLSAQFLPIGYKINFGDFTVAPTVTAFGN